MSPIYSGRCQLLATASLLAAALGAPGPPLPECPAFAGAGEEPHRCECEIAESTGCRGVTPRFNWIIGLCDEPDAGLPAPDDGKLTPKGGYQCADPMRLNDDQFRPEDGAKAGPSRVDLRYIASYQWGNPCEVALAVACGTSLGVAGTCEPCVVQHEAELIAAGCSTAQWTKACSSCGLALRSSRRMYGAVSERCGSLSKGSCEECLDTGNQEKLMQAGCLGSDLHSFCERKWALVPYSSANTDGKEGEFVDLEQGGLGQAGGAALWTRGAYTPNVPGLGPPGMLFVISCEVCSQFAWFMVNQATLDRGPDAGKAQCAVKQDNCWGTASAGEIDFLETGFWDPNSYNTSHPDGSPNPNLNNSRHYVTGYNGAGRCMPVNKGIAGSRSGVDNPPKDAGGICSNNYFVDDGKPHVFAAVVDRRGATVYRDPDWAGLEATTAAPVLDAAPKKPKNLNPPCESGTGSCAVNTPACLTDKRRHPDRLTPPLGQPDCMETSSPKEWGFCKCTQTDAECAAKPNEWADAPPVRRSRPAGKEKTETRRLQAPVPPPPPAPLYCCNVTALNATAPPYGTCYELNNPDGAPAAGKLCADPICSQAKDWNACDLLTDTWGDPCIPQFPAAQGFPNCGSGSHGKGDCLMRCDFVAFPIILSSFPLHFGSFSVKNGRCGGIAPPPAPPAEAVYCTACPADSCVRRRIEMAAHFCNDPANCVAQEWPGGRYCCSEVCDAQEGQASCEEAGCNWQDDGGLDVTWLDKTGANQTVFVPKCGINSVDGKEADQRCNPPPYDFVAFPPIILSSFPFILAHFR